MKLFIIIITILFSKFLIAQDIDISSVESFYSISEKISLGKEISEQEWKELFNTSGYYISTQSDVRKTVVKKMMLYAYNDKFTTERDSVLQIDLFKNINNTEMFLGRLTLQNYLDMKKNDKKLKKFLQDNNFANLKSLSKNRLKEFLVNPIDSLIIFPPVCLLCYEPDAQSKLSGIVVDYNYFYINNGANDNFLAHEMYHTYRRNFVNEKFIRHNNFTSQLNKVHNEGIADLIDKDGNIAENFEKFNAPSEIVEMYVNAYNETPTKLKEFEGIVLSFLHEEINEDTFNVKLKNFFTFGGHPNGFYMTSLIVKAGLQAPLIENFYNSHKFLLLYNEAAKKLGGFIFSEEVIEYSNQITKNYYPEQSHKY